MDTIKEFNIIKEFKVNEYITLKLIEEINPKYPELKEIKNIIFIAGEPFEQCRYLLLTEIDGANLHDYQDQVADVVYDVSTTSIDAQADKLDRSMEIGEDTIEILPEEEFWAHCSNLQAWAESDYDTRLLHSNLAFPLLKKLREIGDPKAKRMFKDEISKRFKNGTNSTRDFLIIENYLDDYLSEEELWSILPSEAVIIKEIKDKLGCEFTIGGSKCDSLIGWKDKKNQLGFSLKDNAIYTISFHNFDLSEETWDWILEKLLEIKSIKNLNFGRNKLRTIPDSIGEFKKLERLYLNGNKLKKLPESIGNLSSLKELDLYENQLETLPESIGNLKALNALFLHNNLLTTIPESIGNLKSLTALSLSENQLKFLPDSIGDLESLDTIHLDDNQLESIPESICNIKTLEDLFLMGNKISESDEVIQKLKENKRRRIYI